MRSKGRKVKARVVIDKPASLADTTKMFRMSKERVGHVKKLVDGIVESSEKRRFARLQLTFVLDMGRDFESPKPYELHNIEAHLGDVLERGLSPYLARRSLVRLMRGTVGLTMKSLTRSQLAKMFPLPVTPSEPIKRQRRRSTPKRAATKTRKKGRRA